MKVLPVKNFISKYLIVSVMLLTTPHLAFADEQNDSGLVQKSWFVEEVSKSLSETDGFYDADTGATVSSRHWSVF